MNNITSINISLKPIKHVYGRPTKYSEEMLIRTEEYISSSWTSGKPLVPFIEELALLLDVDEDTINNWCKAKNQDGEPRFPEFFGAIKRLKTLQQLRLLQRCLTRYNPAGAIFLLKTVHGMVEAEKRIIASNTDNHLKIEIVEDNSYFSR